MSKKCWYCQKKFTEFEEQVPMTFTLRDGTKYKASLHRSCSDEMDIATREVDEMNE